MTYTIRAYKSRQQAESGRFQPEDNSNTGSWTTAQHIARGLATDYGFALVVNNETGERHYFD
jgi:hypothetical protein